MFGSDLALLTYEILRSINPYSVRKPLKHCRMGLNALAGVMDNTGLNTTQSKQVYLLPGLQGNMLSSGECLQ